MEIKNLECRLGKKTILNDLSFTLEKGKIYVLLGKNGCGKTTLLRTLSGLINPGSGSFFEGNEDLSALSVQEKAKRIAYLPQSLPSPAIRVMNLLRMARYPYTSFGRDMTEADEKKITQAIEKTGIQDKVDRLVCHLSGGERTMAYLTMALSKDCDYYFLDEPFAALDIPSQEKLYQILLELKKEGKCILLSMHNLLFAAEKSEHILLLDQGKLLFDGAREDFLNSHCYQDIYGVEIVKAKDEQGNVHLVTRKISC